MVGIVVQEGTEGVVTLTMSSPKNLNALSDEMIEALTGSLLRIGNDPKIRVVILRGEGKAFCAGHDLKQMTARKEERGDSYYADLFQRCAKMVLTLRDLPQPVIAQVHGVATAAGCQLVASCDLAVATDTTRFGVNGVNIGLFCSTPMVALSRNISRKKAFELLTTGEFLTAAEAETHGLINHAVPEAELPTVTRELAEKIAAKRGAVVKLGKEAFYKQLELPMDKAYAYTGDVMARNLALDDTQEGIAAFLEKRAPNWD